MERITMMFTKTLGLVALLSVAVAAQNVTLQTTLLGGNGQKGAMFNVVNISAGGITVASFDQNFLNPGTSSMEIYTKTGSYVGSEAIAANWSLVGSASGLVHGGQGVAVPLPIAVNTSIPAGATQAFYVTVTNATATNVAYTNGNLVVPATTAGAVAFSDANIQFVCGVGKVYPFAGTFGGPTPGGFGRCWNGKINYFIGGIAPAPAWQVNGPAAYLDFDFLIATPTTGAVVTKCIGAPVNACANSFGAPADIALNTLPIVSSTAGGIALTNAHVVNLDLTGNFLFLINAFIPLGAASGTCPIFFNAFPGTISAQVVVLDPTSPINISLSQASQATGAPSSTLTILNADDAMYLVNLTASPLCNATGLNYYGTTYTTMVVSTNGIVFPGVAGTNAWVPTIATAISYPGLFGVWSDWQSDVGTGSIVVSNNIMFGGVDIDYTNIPYWGTATTSTFRVALDTVGPRLESLSTLGTDPVTPTMLVMSRGGGLATNAGATAFSLGGSGTTAANTDMLYAIGTGTPTLAGGANDLWFTFNGTGGVDWAGF